MRRRDPYRMTKLLNDLTRQWQPASVLAELQRMWPEIAGEAVARWAAPVEERAGVVTVACKDSTVAQELDLQKVSLLARLADSGAPPVTDLRFIVK